MKAKEFGDKTHTFLFITELFNSVLSRWSTDPAMARCTSAPGIKSVGNERHLLKEVLV